ncbi:hypothetical protein HK096_002106, partial [Nowakowskiella sp. JEL0078]
PAPGQPEIAQKMHGLLTSAGIPAVLNSTRGWDHGVFVPMLLITPKADIPIIQMSLVSNLDPSQHFAIGKALSSLRDEGVAIVGSGLSFHNMSEFRSAGFSSQPNKITNQSKNFDDAVTTVVTSEDASVVEQGLINWKGLPSAKYCHPREEHLIPLMVIAGAGASKGDKGKKVFEDSMGGQKFSSW